MNTISQLHVSVDNVLWKKSLQVHGGTTTKDISQGASCIALVWSGFEYEGIQTTDG